jgi:5-methylcytosine-specific restriction endonuclease McrA
VLRLVQQTSLGQIVEVLLPEEVPGALSDSGKDARRSRSVPIEDLDFFRTPALREAIHAREHATCFYCLRRVNVAARCLDHVVAQARAGGNSYRNVVSCCLECNSRKGQTPAAEFLRWLYRQGRLSSRDLTARLRALRALAAGKLRPSVPDSGSALPRKDRARLHPATYEIVTARRQR